MTGTFDIKCLGVKALPPHLQKETTETQEILQESQPQAAGIPTPAPGLSKTSRVVLSPHLEQPQTPSAVVCSGRILRAELELTVLTQQGTAPAPAKQSDLVMLIQEGTKMSKVQWQT